MVCMNGQVEAHKALKVILIKAKHMSEVGSPIQLRVGFNVLAVFVSAPVYVSSYPGQPRNKIHDVFVHRVPVIFFIDSFPVSCGKNRFSLQCHHSSAELCHGCVFFGSASSISNTCLGTLLLRA